MAPPVGTLVAAAAQISVISDRHWGGLLSYDDTLQFWLIWDRNSAKTHVCDYAPK